ncbi:MAG TPA: ECF transporter S component [Firmicutes bacterium]|nr:ECF transporter S component [Bacillota bacterium]HHY98186.1 ECF transporter S component [Bacillota bacterium]
MQGQGAIGREVTWRQGLIWLTRTAVLLALTLAFQMMGLPQPVTGPVVNAMLLLSCIFVGPLGGVVVGLFTPWIAFVRGILAPPLGPMIPFISLGNAVLVLVFGGIRYAGKKALLASIVGVIAGAVAKFLVLSSAVRMVVQVPPPVAKAMQTPQLVTALIGGAVALAVAQGLHKALPGKGR